MLNLLLTILELITNLDFPVNMFGIICSLANIFLFGNYGLKPSNLMEILKGLEFISHPNALDVAFHLKTHVLISLIEVMYLSRFGLILDPLLGFPKTFLARGKITFCSSSFTKP